MTGKKSGFRTAQWRATLTAPTSPSTFRSPSHATLDHVRAGRNAEAAQMLERTLSDDPNDVEALGLLALVQHRSGASNRAIELLGRALELEPRYAELHNNLGNILKATGSLDAAIEHYRLAIGLKPGYADAHNNLGNALMDVGDGERAMECYRTAIRLDARDAATHSNLGAALRSRGSPHEAIECYERALALQPGDATVLANLGNALNDAGRLEEAVAAYRKALQMHPQHTDALAGLVRRMQSACMWDGLDELHARVLEPAHLRSGRVNMFNFVSLDATASQQLEAARAHTCRLVRNSAARAPAAVNAGRIRIGYVSADFSEHPVAYLIAHVLEMHDRSRFDIFGYACHAADDTGAMRSRVRNACDAFVDVSSLTPPDAAERIRADALDVLVDLTGYTRNGAYRALALRPAPVQVSFLGYPATMGAPFIDYLITDAYVTPPAEQVNFDEKFAYLPQCFQPNDCSRSIAPVAPTRAQCGLAEDAVVACCFNQSYKITPQVFDVWCRLLAQVEKGVLWLGVREPAARSSLHREASRRGLAPQRIVFADWAPTPADHLARLANADLFLDTTPFNAHTTASDALFAGVPLLTCSGRTYASRVAGSLLHAVGLPQLVTHTLTEYESLALTLMRDSALLGGFRRQLAETRLTAPLFSSGSYVKHLEAAYVIMAGRARAGEPPAQIRVPA